MEATRILADLGFGDYEARAYVALLRRSPANGYELAKLSDIPRANIYAVLQKLEDRGAVVRVETPDGVRYAPVMPAEMLQRMQGQYQRSLAAADLALGQVAAPREAAEVWSIAGYAALLEHARSLLGTAGQQLLLAVWPEEARALGDDVKAAAERGVAVRTLCLAGCAQECGGCRGQIHRHRLLPEQAARWLVVIPDRTEVLAGEIMPADGATPDDETTRSIRTRQPMIVHLTASYIRHSIALAAILGDAGSRLAPLLTPTTQEMLRMIGREEGLADWLEQLQHLPADSTQESKT